MIKIKIVDSTIIRYLITTSNDHIIIQYDIYLIIFNDHIINYYLIYIHYCYLISNILYKLFFINIYTCVC